MSRYCAGEADAFRELYSYLAPKLLAYLRSLTRNPALADDLLQQTFLKVHRSRDKYVSGANPSPWMYAIAHRTFIDETRKQKRTRARMERVSNENHGPADITGTPAAIKEEPIDPELVEKVMSALDSLPASQKQAVALTKLQGKSLKEAALIAGTSVGAMKLRAHRGYQAVRKILSTEGTKDDG